MTASACDGSAATNSLIFASQTVHGQWKQLEDPSVGFSLSYPADWMVDGQVIATEFAGDARCRSVRMIDFEPPSFSGAAAPIEQSFVQVCAKTLENSDSLDQYMHRVYGESLKKTFAITNLNELRAYQSMGQERTRMVFTQTRNRLIQIVASIATSPGIFPEREEQVEKILKSLSLL